MTRVWGRFTLGALALTLTVSAQQQPPAAPGAGQEPRAGGVLQDVNLHDLTLAVQKITKKTFLWTEDLGLKNKRVHLVSDRPIADNPEALFKAYQSILQVSDMGLVPAGKPGEEIYKIVPAPVILKKSVTVQKEGVVELEDRYVTRLFTLQHVSPRDVQAALINMASFPQNILAIESAGILVATDNDYNIRRFEDIIRVMDTKKPDIELKLMPLKNAIAADVETMMNGLVQTLIGRQVAGRAPGAMPGVPGSESVKVVADKRTNSVVLLAEPSRLPQLEDIVKRLDAETPFETSGIYVSHLRHTNAVDIARTLNAMYRISVDDKGVPGGGSSTGTRPGQTVAPPGAGQPSVPGAPSGGGFSSAQLTGGEPTIVADLRSNSIIMVTDMNTYKTLEGVIRRLDQRRPQVLIKATVVEIRTTDDFDLGVELARLEDPSGRTILAGRTAFGLSTITADATNNVFNITPIPTPGVTLLALRDRIGNVPAILHALREKAKVDILDEPEAATNDNGFAEMKVKAEVPVLQQTLTGTGIVQNTFSKYETAETVLQISPHISEGGYLRLETKVQIQKFANESADPTIPPTKSAREITTKEIMVPNGGTMVIGGIVTQDKSDSVSGLPVLSDLPLLGWLFRRNQQNEEKRTLYIFLTPYILYDYGFGDYRALSRERKFEAERLRGDILKDLNVDVKAEKLPESTFRFGSNRPAGRKEE
jgi:general secretion pathway protein D